MILRTKMKDKGSNEGKDVRIIYFRFIWKMIGTLKYVMYIVTFFSVTCFYICV